MNPHSASAPSELRKFVAGPLSTDNQTGNPMKRRSTPWSVVLCMAIVLGGSGELVSAPAQSPPLNPDLIAAKWPAGLSGKLVWGTREYPLHSATQVLRLAREER